MLATDVCWLGNSNKKSVAVNMQSNANVHDKDGEGNILETGLGQRAPRTKKVKTNVW